LLRFIVGVTIFGAISGIGRALPVFQPFLEPPLELPVIILLGVLYVVLPHSLSYGIMALDIGVQLSSHFEIAIVVTMFLLCVIFFYARLAPKESILIIAMLAACQIRLPFLVPLLAGLYLSITSLIPVAIGVFIWSFIPVVAGLLDKAPTAGMDFMKMPETLGGLLPELAAAVSSSQSWVLHSFIFAMVLLVVFAISRISIDYSKDIAVVLGALLVIVSFVITQILTGMEEDLLSLSLRAVLSALIVEAVRFFDVVLDYNKAERIEFEDEDNYYFVKVVPKVIMSRRSKPVRRGRAGERAAYTE
jgi:hypothetical protein